MYNPCIECYHRYGREYSIECDCAYAEAVKRLLNIETEKKPVVEEFDSE